MVEYYEYINNRSSDRPWLHDNTMSETVEQYDMVYIFWLITLRVPLNLGGYICGKSGYNLLRRWNIEDAIAWVSIL